MKKSSKLDSLIRTNENLVGEVSRLKVENDELRKQLAVLKGVAK